MAIYIIIIAVIIVVFVIAHVKNKRLFEEGKVIDRGVRFYENAEIFTTSATYDEIEKAIRATNFSDCAVAVKYNSDNKYMVFECGHVWNALLEYKGRQDDKNIFAFAFNSWRTLKGVPYNTDKMNMLETSIEKTFLSIDPQTTVVTQKQKYKTKF